MSNPDPVGWTSTNAGSYYTVQQGDCLWNIALAEVQKQQKAAGKDPLKGRQLTKAVVEELHEIEQANPQIVGHGGSGTYDLIWAGDKIDIPNAAQAPGTAPQADATPGVAVHGNQPGTIIPTGMVLKPGDSYTSPNGQYKLIMQTDGNLVLYENNPDKSQSVVFSTRTYAGNSDNRGTGDHAVVQADGNLVVYNNKPGGDVAGNAVWSSNSAKPENANSVLSIQDDGNLVLYSASGPIWDAAHHNNSTVLNGL